MFGDISTYDLDLRVCNAIGAFRLLVRQHSEGQAIDAGELVAVLSTFEAGIARLTDQHSPIAREQLPTAARAGQAAAVAEACPQCGNRQLDEIPLDSEICGHTARLDCRACGSHFFRTED